MEYDQRHDLKKISPQKDEYAIVIYLDDHLTEFAVELGRASKPRADILASTRNLIKSRYPNLKITMVKIMVGGMVLTSIPLMGGKVSEAAGTSGSSAPTAQVLSSNSIYHQVSSGDTLWNLSVKYKISIDHIKRANHLTSDVLIVNQKLIIPLAFHTVGTGDYLTVLAKKYGTTVDAIKEANSLTSDATFLGQTLTIPMIIGGSTTPVAPVETDKTQSTSYIVVAGDSLSVIAKRFGTTVEALRSANHLTSDIIKIGQVLSIPSNSTSVIDTTPAPNITNGGSYTVQSGDSLWMIAKKYSLSVDQIKKANQLNTDSIQVGQVLAIPNGQSDVPSNNIGGIQKDLQTLGYYTVPATTGGDDSTTKQAISNFQSDYRLPITGVVDDATRKAIDHAVTKQALIKDTKNYLGVRYLVGGTTPSGFDCSGFVGFMFNKHGVSMSRNTSAGFYNTGTPIGQANLQPGDLVFFAVNTTGRISHVGFYMGDNQFISATTSKGIAIYPMDHSYWGKYYVGAKRVY